MIGSVWQLWPSVYLMLLLLLGRRTSHAAKLTTRAFVSTTTAPHIRHHRGTTERRLGAGCWRTNRPYSSSSSSSTDTTPTTTTIPNPGGSQIISPAALQPPLPPQEHQLVNDERGRRLTQDMLARVRQVNGAGLSPEIKASLVPFVVDGVHLGQVRPVWVERLCSYTITNNNNNRTPVFALYDAPNDDNINGCLGLAVEGAGTTYESRSRAVAEVLDALSEHIPGWRHELFPIAPSFYESPLFAMERAAVPILGAIEYGVHVNGLVVVIDTTDTTTTTTTTTTTNDNHHSSNKLHMWLARRAANKSKWPGYLDHIAAGGQPVGISLTDNVVKECGEEAGIPPELCRTHALRPAGVVSYERYVPQRDVVEQVVLFNYDLYLPADFVPRPVDGEVQEFFLWSMEELLESMALGKDSDPIKPNCCSVMIDFLLRHGYVNPEIPGYLDLQRELRGGLCR